MTDFTVHDVSSAPEAAKPLLENSQKNFGFIPNLHGVLAESPETLKAYGLLTDLFGQTSLSAEERNVVWLAVNVEHECRYCVPAHSAIAKMQGVSAETVTALRDASPLDDPRLEALRAFALQVVRQRGDVSGGDVATFLEAGFTKRNVLDVILGIAHKTISNYANHIAETPSDPAFAGEAWNP